MNSTRTRDGWLLVEHPVTQPRARVLLLPGLLCTDLIFADMLDDPAMEQAGVQLVAGNPPGFKGQPASPGFDFRVETYAQMVEDLARLGSSASTFSRGIAISETCSSRWQREAAIRGSSS